MLFRAYVPGMKYTPGKLFDTEDHDEYMLEWLEGPTTSSDRDLLAAWARARITSLREERDKLEDRINELNASHYRNALK